MQVTSSNLQMSAQRSSAQFQRQSTEVEIFSQRPAAQQAPANLESPRPVDRLSLELESSQAQEARMAAEDDSLDPQLALLKSIIEAITGRLLELFGLELGEDAETESVPAPPTDTPTPPASDFGMRARTLHEYAEYEAVSFRASGSIETADGRSIEFSIQLQMQRSFVERSQSEIIWGDVPQMKDPLVVNFDGNSAGLTADRYSFDINADGTLDQIPGLTPGRAYLIIDRNGNGKVDDGSEVIGAMTGDAYAELRALDDDGNGFVDAGDVSFSQLGLWRPGMDGYDSTSDRGVAALSTDSLATEFKLTDADNEQLGQLRRTSIYLSENGAVNTTQQVDLVS